MSKRKTIDDCIVLVRDKTDNELLMIFPETFWYDGAVNNPKFVVDVFSFTEMCHSTASYDFIRGNCKIVREITPDIEKLLHWYFCEWGEDKPIPPIAKHLRFIDHTEEFMQTDNSFCPKKFDKKHHDETTRQLKKVRGKND